jgi:hypothetical protein
MEKGKSCVFQHTVVQEKGGEDKQKRSRSLSPIHPSNRNNNNNYRNNNSNTNTSTPTPKSPQNTQYSQSNVQSGGVKSGGVCQTCGNTHGHMHME